MSSPMHKFLFSPPSSPPHKAVGKGVIVKDGLTSIMSLLLPTEFIPRSPLEGSSADLKARSPRTPQQRHFTLDSTYPSPFSRAPSSIKTPICERGHVSVQFEDIDATPRVDPTTRTVFKTPKFSSPPFLPSNVPSTHSAAPTVLPRPLLRLLFLASLLFSSAMILAFVPAARLPSLRAASISRRLALAPDIRAYLDVESMPRSWSDVLDRDYQPPQIRSPNMMKRGFGRGGIDAMVPAPLKAVRPTMTPRPLPTSHELLALQSYVLESAYNILASDVDPSSPLDANAVLSISSHKLGKPGSEAEKVWLSEIEKERKDDIVIWYGGDGSSQLPHAILDVLRAMHGPSRHPTLIPCHSRSDLRLLQKIFDRLEFPLKHQPLVMIGNTPIIGDVEALEELRGSGKLLTMLEKIGWVRPSKPAVLEVTPGTKELEEDSEDVRD